MKNFSNLSQLVDFIDKKYQNPKAFSFLDNEKQIDISTEQFAQNVRCLTLALNNIGLSKKDGFAIIAKPNPIWLQIDFAAISSGAISVPIFPDISSQNLLYEIENSGCKFAFCDSEENLQLLQKSNFEFKKIIIRGFSFEGENIIHFDDLLNNGTKLFTNNPDKFTKLTGQIDEDDLATIIYTSGSTGVPKGVEITHKNLITQINSTAQCFPLKHDKDVALSFLPLAHIFERMVVSFYISQGISIYFADDVKNVGALLKTIKPTLMTVVPRVLEKVLAKMKSGVNEASFIKKLIGKTAFYFAPKFAKNGFPKSEVKPSLLYKILNLLVYKKLRAALGGKMHMIICGGSAISPDVEKFFCGIGVNLYVGYGLTESSPVLAVNFKNNQKLGTVGKTFPDVETKLGEGGELLARGTNIMRGYHKEEAKTKDVIDKNGWLKTGDLAKIDDDGFITIVGRKKEMFKTAYAKYVSPVPIEQKLMARWSLFSGACIVAEGRKFVSCLLFVEFDLINQHKERFGFKDLSNEEFLRSDFVGKKIGKLIQRVNKNLNDWEQIKKFHLSDQPISIETGELTPSMKLRRNFLEEKFKDVIDGFYPK
ncbi:MAG: long-chain acyl-CoA synthetase [Rickettsiales bacterium]|jgi:long-chain acyl-CoA synthetase